MVKRSLIVFLLMVFVLMLSACDREDEFEHALELNTDLINHNVDAVNTTGPDVIDEVVLIDLDDLTIVMQHLQVGIIIVENDLGEQAVYSTVHDALILPHAENVMYFLMFDSVFRGYIAANNPVDGTYAVYDVNGAEVIPTGDYQTATVSGRMETDFDDFGNLIERRYYETITTLTTEDFNSGDVDSTVRYTRVNVATGERTTIAAPETYSRGDRYEELLYPDIDMTRFGLEGYYAKMISNVLYLRDKEGVLVSTTPFPTGGTLTMLTVLDGHLFYQTMTQVPDPAEVYDMISAGNKYILTTVSVDLLTGDETVLDFDYVVMNDFEFFDEEGVVRYVRLRVHPIESKMRVQHTTREIVVNKDGLVGLDLSGMSFSDLRRLDDDLLYNSSTRIVFDNDLNPLFEVPSAGTGFINHKGLIIFTHNGLRGVTDYHGVVQIPFEYDWLSSAFYDDATYGRDANNVWYGIDLDGNTVLLGESVQSLVPGVLLTRDLNPDVDTGLYAARIVTYMDGLYHALNLTNTIVITDSNQSPFHHETVVRLSGEDGFVFLSIRRSTPE